MTTLLEPGYSLLGASTQRRHKLLLAHGGSAFDILSARFTQKLVFGLLLQSPLQGLTLAGLYSMPCGRPASAGFVRCAGGLTRPTSAFTATALLVYCGPGTRFGLFFWNTFVPVAALDFLSLALLFFGVLLLASLRHHDPSWVN